MQTTSKMQALNSLRIRLIPSLFLCLSIGFLGALCLKTVYLEILEVEYSASNFIATKLVLLFLFIMGVVIKKILNDKILDKLELSTLFLLILSMLVILIFSSKNLQVDYIFYTDPFLFVTSLLSFTTGLLVSNLKQVRLWFFLMGGIIFVIYTFLNPELKLKPESYIMPLLFVITSEFSLFKILKNKQIFEYKKIKFKTSRVNDSFFYSFLAIFIFHSYQYYELNSNPDAYILGAGLGLFLFNLAYHFELFRKEHKWKFLVARIILLLVVALSLHNSKINTFLSIFLFIDTSMIAFFRPFRYNLTNSILSIVSGILFVLILYFLNTYYGRLEWKILLVSLFCLLSLLPFLIEKQLRIFTKILASLGTILISIYLFTPSPFDQKISFSKEESLKPIPFLLLPIELNSTNFVFHNTNLPFENLNNLPKQNDFKNKTIVLGLEKRPEVILTYIYHLHKNKYPFLLITDPKIILNEKIDFLNSKEYPLFKVYFSKQTPELLKETQVEASGWELEMIESKIKQSPNIDDIPYNLQSLLIYSTGSLYNLANKYNKVFFTSYKEYSKYFYLKENYENALLAANYALKHSEDEEILEICYNSLMRITPDEKNIEVMRVVSKKNKYKEEISKRLYPLYLSLNEKESAISIINELITYYTSISGEESQLELKNLKVEKAKIFLQSSSLLSADEIISSELRKEPESIVWKKLKNDLTTIRENNTKAIKQLQSRTEIPQQEIPE
jgi:hypothetical protein